jgi:hypothetical protein
VEHIYLFRCFNYGSFAVGSHFANQEFASCPKNLAIQTELPQLRLPDAYCVLLMTALLKLMLIVRHQ